MTGRWPPWRRPARQIRGSCWRSMGWARPRWSALARRFWSYAARRSKSILACKSDSLRRWADARFEGLLSVIRQRANVLRPKHLKNARITSRGEVSNIVLAGLGLRAGIRCEAGNELTYRRRSKLRLVVAARKVIFFAPGSIDAGLVRRSEDFVVLERSRRWIDLGDGKGRMIPVDWRDRRDHFDRDTLC